MIDYTGTVALVTGAASGIGEAIASALAARGARVLCADVNTAGAESVAAAIGNGAKAMHCNMAEPEAAAQLIEDAHAVGDASTWFVPMRVLALAASLPRPILTMSVWPSCSRSMSLRASNWVKPTAQLLAQSGERGRMMVTGSEHSLSVPSAVRAGYLAMYGATKHALLIAMEWFRIEQEKGPLDLHVLMPGAVYTPLIAAQLPDPAMAPPEFELILPEQCADIALKGMDLGCSIFPPRHISSRTCSLASRKWRVRCRHWG